MPGYTYRIITLWFCLLFGVTWAWLSYRSNAMYVPPGEVQAFLVAVVGGKFAQSIKGAGNNGP